MERVESVIQRLEREYGEFEIVEKTWKHSTQRYQKNVDQFERGALGGAGVWVTNDASEVLLARNEREDGWAEPGGKVEPGEDYETAAKREVREETGIECSITDVCDLQIIENIDTETDAPSIFEAIVVFHGEYIGGEPRAREGEIAEVGWFAEPPDNLLYEEVGERPYPANG